MADFSLLTSAAPLMKRYYDDRRVYSMTYKNRPLYAWLPKKTGVVGEQGGYNVPVTIDDIPGESADFASAVAARAGDSHEVWQLNRVKRYATATLDWETVRAMSNDMGAFMRAVTPRINSAINQNANSIAMGVYMDGTGARGITAAAAGWPADGVVLSSPLEARRFSLGRTVVMVDEADLTAAPAAGTAVISSIEQATATIGFAGTIPAGWAALGTAGAGNGLFALGDTGDLGGVIDGMDAWGPAAVPAPGALFKGVDRAKYPEKLLMLHYDAAGVATDVAVREAAATVQANEGSPDALFVSPLRWAQLESILASQSRYEMMMGSDGRTGFDSIVINAGGGKVNIVADPWCPENTGYMLERETWDLFSIDRFPDFVSEDGNRLHRMEGTDAVEFRVGGYLNTVCRAPGHNIILDFDAIP